MPRNVFLIIALAALVFVAGIPLVSAGTNDPLRNVSQGEILYVYDSNLNLAPALNGAAGNPLDALPDLTVIGWWASGADITTTRPVKTIDLVKSYSSFTLTARDFDGHEGNWYLVGRDGALGFSKPVFYVTWFM